MAAKFETVEDYLASRPAPVAAALEQVRAVIRAALPGATEAISYQIAAFQLGGKTVVHYAGWKDHISLYPVPAAEGELAAAIERYRAGKGTLRFPLAEPLPTGLIVQVVTRLAAQRGAPENG